MKLLKRILRFLKRKIDFVFGSLTDEFYWRFRHLLGDKDWAKDYLSLGSPNDPQRQLLIKHVSTYKPQNLLEIGCASGPNLYAFSRAFPETQFFGIDISKNAIRTGTAWMRSRDIKNVQLSAGKADNLKKFPTKSIDIVLSVATMLYIGPDKIDQVINEMIRVARQAIILIEWHSEPAQVLVFDHWAYNWHVMFKRHGQANISLTKIASVDQAGGWRELGCLVEIKL